MGEWCEVTETTGALWTTATGDEIPLDEMSTQHIRNALAIVKKIEDDGPPGGFPMFQGEMAQDAAEHQFFQAEDRYDEASWWVTAFEEELKKREQSREEYWP